MVKLFAVYGHHKLYVLDSTSLGSPHLLRVLGPERVQGLPRGEGRAAGGPNDHVWRGFMDNC